MARYPIEVGKMSIILAKNLRQLRGAKKPEEWAKELGELGVQCSKTTIHRWERGLQWPSPDKLKIIADLFDIELEDLFRRDLLKNGQIIREPTKITISPDLKETHEMIESNQEFAEFIDTVARLQKDQRILLYMTARQLAGQDPFLK